LASISLEGEDDYGELKKLSEISITKATASNLPMKTLASVLAAYSVNYKDEMGAKFRKIEKCIYTFCENNFIEGLVLVEAEENDAYKIMTEMIEYIIENYVDGSPTVIRISLEVRFSKFMRLIQNDSSEKSLTKIF